MNVVDEPGAYSYAANTEWWGNVNLRASVQQMIRNWYDPF